MLLEKTIAVSILWALWLLSPAHAYSLCHDRLRATSGRRSSVLPPKFQSTNPCCKPIAKSPHSRRTTTTTIHGRTTRENNQDFWISMSSSFSKGIRDFWNHITTKPNDPRNKTMRRLSTRSLSKSCFVIASYLSFGVAAYRTLLFPKANFSLVDALYFSVVSLTTIGYGDIVPVTTQGKVFCSIFGFFGILLWSSAIATIGTTLVQLESDAIKANFKIDALKRTMNDFYHKKNLLSEDDSGGSNNEQNNNNNNTSETVSRQGSSSAAAAIWKSLRKPLAKAILIILSGGCLIGNIEGWTWMDSIYYSIMTATTIGYGDVSPQTPRGRWVAIGMIPILLAAFGELFATFGLILVRKQTRALFQSQYDRAYWMTQGRAVAMDLNGDGKISSPEFVLYMLLELGMVANEEVDELREQFARFDVTNSGYIETEDLMAMKKLRVAQKLKARTIQNGKNEAADTNQIIQDGHS